VIIMKQEFSISWKSSKQPRKQRKYRYNAPMHVRQKLVSAHLDKALRKEYKKRSMPVRTGDEVKIMRGKFKKKSGKVSEVNLKSLKVYVEGIATKKVTGQEALIALEPSNLMITKLKTDDQKRMKFMKPKTARDKK
jgi:large subunit ribosomal protein L24